jgi:rare lipoprotein A (peptidoglycan hydrolase)
MVVAAAVAPAQSAVAQTDPQASQPVARVSRVGVAKRQLDVKAGRPFAVVGRVLPAAAGLVALLQIRRGSHWVTLDRDRTAASGRYVLRDRVGRPMSVRARVRVVGADGRVRRTLGRLNVYRTSYASWYGPGFYGRRLGCGGTLTAGRMGVAHKTLPCGTKVTFRHGDRTVRVPVIDRGPYVGGREYDLTAATAQRLAFSGHGAILSTR